MSEQRGDPFEETIAAYVLGATDAEETRAVERHLAECAECRELERRLREVAVMLPLAAQGAEPSPDLRQRILAGAGARAEDTRAAPARQRRVIPWPRLAMPRMALAVITVLVLAIAGLGVWNVSLHGQLDRAQAAVATRRMEPASTTLASARGSVLLLNGQNLLVVSFHDMPQPAEGQVYELWLGEGGRFVPAGVFRPDPQGSKVVAVDEHGARYSVIALTVEPGPDGTAQPTQAPGMSGSL
ncbi:MAG TPA: anti-sigma factor [Candidatus Dormibacteraeota bacterium]|jgi:anti-sigma-K factor RskA|nr:anti-sigma factor [Candidatus Dormibacteraeota bacterium]